MKYQRFIVILMIISISSGLLLCGKSKLSFYVKDSSTKYPLDSVNAFLFKDGILQDWFFLSECYVSDQRDDAEKFTTKYFMEFLFPIILNPESSGKHELVIMRPCHLPKVFSIDITGKDESIELNDIYLDKITTLDDSDDLIFKQKTTVKADIELDSLDISENSTLRHALNHNPHITISKDDSVSFREQYIGKFNIMLPGKNVIQSGELSEVLDLPASILSNVIIYQNEVRDQFLEPGKEKEIGPLTMNLILKDSHNNLIPENLSQENSKLKVVSSILGITLFLLLLVIVILSIHYRKVNRELIILRQGMKAEDNDTTDFDSNEESVKEFREQFIKNNINGASEEELKRLEDFIKTLDPEFFRNIKNLKLKERSFHDAMLIRLGTGLSDCANVLNGSASSIGMNRLRLFRNLEDNRGTKKWENYIFTFRPKKYKTS